MNIRDHPLYVATQPEILRVNQKDEEYKDLLKANLVDGLDLFNSRIINYRLLAKHDDFLKMLSGLLYYGATWLRGSSTLGEEYSALQTFSLRALKRSGDIKMTRSSRSLFLIIHLILPFLSTSVIKKFYNRLISQNQANSPKTLWSILLRNISGVS